MNALIFLVKTFTDLYLLMFLLRFIMQWVRADFYNPFAQVVVRITNPLVVPARRLLPSVGSIDAPLLILLILLEAVVTWLLLAIAFASAIPPVTAASFIELVALRLVNLLLWFYTIAIVVYALLSWFGQSYSPIGELLDDLVSPLLRPVRRLIPIVAGIDLSPAIVVILIIAARLALPLDPLLR
jgi:YggT family protein